MVVAEVMSRDPYTLDVGDTLKEAVLQLTEADVRHLPVLDHGSLVGIISDRDLRAAAPEAMLLAGEGRDESLMARPVSEIMSSNVLSVVPEAELSEAVDLMLEHRVGAVPVVEADSLKLIGIVSYMDALRAARDLL